MQVTRFKLAADCEQFWIWVYVAFIIFSLSNFGQVAKIFRLCQNEHPKISQMIGKVWESDNSAAKRTWTLSTRR